MKNPIPLLRTVALLEGISFVLLLGVAMPLKYKWAMPQAVLIAGSVHGGLFLLFCWALMRVVPTANWPRSRIALVLASSVVPTGTFWIDGRLRQWAEAWRAPIE